ncbi:molybdate ABC transporter permease subunit [Basilea psittacipulmonis]|uniref:Molybdenum transport system permease n=1 Tax=Basilea psittacipulmonis DSM 24701 TaxID=1072685 RepID=A0A077DI20_9BURK|nr:molybdate ABC transporter permease subunit [Basilea psittacipulmonis]AIL32763.1 hypothetical protein IX83_05070 [Basilea psittacipulmonis DSM 24701]
MLDSSVWTALALSFKVATWATLISALLAIVLAYFFTRRDFWGKEILDAILTLPMVLPPTVLGYYLLVLLGQKGIIGAWLKSNFDLTLVFTWQGAVVASVLITFPLIFKPARSAFETISPIYEQAAKTLGLSALAIFFRVCLPLAWRTILTGVLLGFSRSLGEFGATLMIAGSIPGRTETLSLAVYQAVQNGQDDLANQLVGLMVLVCVIVLCLIKYLSRQKGMRC